MKNEALQTIYSNLVRSVYALDGIDGKFVANLCQRIPFKPRSSDWPEKATLALIPANQVAAVESEILRLDDAMAAVREVAQEDWTDDAWVSLCYHEFAEHKAELERKEAELAGLLKAAA